MFENLLPLFTYTEIAAGVILMITASYVAVKIYQGSKSIFAYTLMGLTFLDGAQFFSMFFIFNFRHTVYLGGYAIPVVNMIAVQTASYCYYLVSL